MICAHAVSVDIKRFSGVESVDVSLNKGMAAVKLTPGNAVVVEDLWQAIRKDGFTPKETHVVVRGMLDGAKLRVTGTNQIYDLTRDPQNPNAVDEVQKQSGKTITIEARLVPGKDVKTRVSILVQRVVAVGN
jgi:hypothetical protein